MEEDRNIKEPRVPEEPKEIQKPSDGSSSGGGSSTGNTNKEYDSGVSVKKIAIITGSLLLFIIIMVAIFA